MSCTLKIEPHIRGHIAGCNGRVDRVGAKAEQCRDNPQNATHMAALMETQARENRERKRQELELFKRRVRQRSTEWERTKQRQIAISNTETIASEQKITEQALKLDKTKVQRSFEVGQDIEDVCTVATLTPPAGVPSTAQLARNKLLALRGSASPKNINTDIEKTSLVHFAPSVQYEPVNTINHQNSPVHAVSKPPKNVLKLNKFTNPGHMEHIKKKQAALQYRLFRRLYSDLEREQARHKQRQLTQTQQIEALRKDKEATRRLIEDEANAFDSFSTVSTEATEDRERAREWAELVVVEERKQQLQKSKESERFAEALKARLKEKLKTKEVAALPLCSCGTTIWDADPFTCANNCPFYRNPEALEKALAAQLQSLEL